MMLLMLLCREGSSTGGSNTFPPPTTFATANTPYSSQSASPTLGCYCWETERICKFLPVRRRSWRERREDGSNGLTDESSDDSLGVETHHQHIPHEPDGEDGEVVKGRDVEVGVNSRVPWGSVSSSPSDPDLNREEYDRERDAFN